MAGLSKNRFAQLVIVILLGVCFVVVYPVKSITTRSCEIKVVDSLGNPVGGVWVKQFWQDYSVEFSGHEEEKYTGDDGIVRFSERTARKPILKTVIVSGFNLLTQTIHASFDKSLLVVASQHHKEQDIICEGYHWGRDEAVTSQDINNAMQVIIKLDCRDAKPKKIGPPYLP